MTGAPLPIPTRPAHATEHCRHYSYEQKRFPQVGGPRCAAGCDLSEPAATRACMPPRPGLAPPTPCPRREEYTDEERAAWRAYVRASLERTAVIMAAIPKGGPGTSGTLPCPGCGTGTVSWGRASRNGHLHAACSTPLCFAVMQ